MTENTRDKRMLHYVSGAILAVWAAFVLFRFFREHPLDPAQVWRLVRSFGLPPPPTDFLKIAAAVKHLLLACFLVVVGLLSGRCVLRVTGVRQRDRHAGDRSSITLELLLALGLGWGLLMYLTLLLGVVGCLYGAVMWGLLVLLFLIGIRDVPPLCRDVRAWFSSGGSEQSTMTVRLGMILLGVILFFLAVIALAPTITHDAMVYHLNVPRIYASEHRIVAVPYNLFSNTVLNIGMLYTVALLVDSFILANLIHWILGVGALALLYAFARIHFGRATAALAVLIFFFTPSVLNEMPIAYVDMGMVFYFLLALYCLWMWRKEGRECWFVLLGVFAGIYAGIKYTSIHGLIAMCAMVVAAELYSRERKIGKVTARLAMFGGIVTLFVAPYLLKNWLVTGNPVYPLMYNVFDGRWLEPRQVERMLSYVNSHGMGHDIGSLLALPWNTTIHGNAGYSNFDTIITPLWLIFLPAFVFVRPKPKVLKWAALLCVVYFLSWAASTHITRYMMPVFPLLSLLCAYTVVALAEKAEKFSRPLSICFKAGSILACGLVWFSFGYFYPLRVPSDFGPVVWGKQAPDEFLSERVPNYPVFAYINENLPPDARLAFFWDNRGFFCERPQVGDSVFEAPSMIELAHEAGTAEAFRAELEKMGITHILFNGLFLARFPVHTISNEDESRLAHDFKVLEKFLSRYCVPLFSADGATLYALRG